MSNAATPMGQPTTNPIRLGNSGVLTRPSTRPSTLSSGTLTTRVLRERRELSPTGLQSLRSTRPKMIGARPDCPTPIISLAHR